MSPSAKDIERAAFLLGIASEYIQRHHPDGEIFYDEAVCDGYCVAEECSIQAEIFGEK